MGVDSGLPDFRGREGFWHAYPAAAKLGLAFEQLANPSWFDRDPALAWAFYGHRLNLYRNTQPHRGFSRLLQLGRTCPKGFFVFTSNVDGHFQKAGFPAERIVECHGSIHFLQCTRPCTHQVWPTPQPPLSIDEDRFRALDPLPHCPHCGALARPNILMFGDSNWIPDRTADQEQHLANWLQTVFDSGAKLTALELGAGSAVPSVRWLLERSVQQTCGTLIRVNPREARVPAGHIGLAIGAAQALEDLANQIFQRHANPP